MSDNGELEVDESLLPMVGKMAEKIGKMKGLPDLQDHRHWRLPGEIVRKDPDGTSLIYQNTESEHWPKIDKVILKALKAMNKKGTRGALGKLQEAAFHLSLNDEEEGEKRPGIQHLALRLFDTRFKVHEYGRLRRVAAGEESPGSQDTLFYGDITPKEMVEAHAVVLRARGILQKQPKKKQEQEK